jgi:SAM-dependent methyltransferase
VAEFSGRRTDVTKDVIRNVVGDKGWAFLKRVVGPFVRSGDATNQWVRIVMNRETSKMIDALGPSGLQVLEISGNYWNKPGLFKTYASREFPAYDVCDRPLDETFDLIIAEQVFEHVLWPYRAARNVHRMLRPGGTFLLTTPFLVKIHPTPYDCSRWTETGMKYLLADCGFALDQIQTGSWGNRKCVKANLGSKWQIYQRWRHSLKNEPDCPVVVWAIARK